METKKGFVKRVVLFIGCMLGTIGMIIAGQIIGSLILSIPHAILLQFRPDWITDAWTTAESYVYFIGIWIVAIAFMRISKKNRPILKAIGRKPSGNTWKNLFLGILIGFCLNGTCALIAFLHQDIDLSYTGFYPISFLIIFLCVFVQSSAEELLCRGFLYQKGMQYFQKPSIAILSNAILFSLLHLLNNGVTVISVINIFLSGLLFSLIVYYMDSIWCAFAVHTAWNFTQNILFGLPNSGIVVPYSVFKLEASTARNSFAYNVSFGIEGTLVADAVLSLACLALFLWGRKHGRTPYQVWTKNSES